MQCKFPYFEDRPHIPITLEYHGKRVKFLPLLDSGADYSVFYKSDAHRLGLDWNQGISLDFHNADGTLFKAKQFLLTMEVERVPFKTKVCFVESTASSMPLLGRVGVFERFYITLCEKEKYVEVKDYIKL
jgi:predicted aspartyl protease